MISKLIGSVSSWLTPILILVAGYFGYHTSNEKHQRERAEEKVVQYDDLIDDLEQAQQISHEVDGLSDDAVSDELHDNNWYRD